MTKPKTIDQLRAEKERAETQLLQEQHMLKEYPDIMTVEQMCEVLGISTKTGYRLLREKKICCLKVGRAYRIPKAHLFTYLCIGGEETSI